MHYLLLLTAVFSNSMTVFASVDCSEAYGGKLAKCEQVECDKKYEEFLGTWEGPFQAFVDKFSLYDKDPKDGVTVETLAVFRPYFNSITYSSEDCLKNIENGDTFIIGRRSDQYPQFTSINFNTQKLETLDSKTKSGRLITGKKGDGTPFLRTIDEEMGLIDYRKLPELSTTSLSVWESVGQPWGTLTVFDGQDLLIPTVPRRSVTVKLKIGIWEGITGQGFHTRK